MILENMSKKEIYKELKLDKERIERIVDRDLDSLSITDIRKIRDKYSGKYTFPRRTLKSPVTGNQYFIRTRVINVTRDKVQANAGVFVKTVFKNETVFIVVPSDVWGYEHLLNSKIKQTFALTVYTSHFIKRYEERYLKSGKTDLIELFDIYLNKLTTVALQIQHIDWKYETEKVRGCTFRVTGGLALGMEKKYDEHFVIANTFVSDDLLRKNQSNVANGLEGTNRLLEFLFELNLEES